MALGIGATTRNPWGLVDAESVRGRECSESLQDPAEQKEPEQGTVDQLKGDQSRPENSFPVLYPVFDLEVFPSVQKLSGMIRIFGDNEFSATHNAVG